MIDRGAPAHCHTRVELRDMGAAEFGRLRTRVAVESARPGSKGSRRPPSRITAQLEPGQRPRPPRPEPAHEEPQPQAATRSRPEPPRP